MEPTAGPPERSHGDPLAAQWRSRMRRLLILAATAAAAAWAAVPSAATVTAAGSLATVSLLAAGEARAVTALLPGWKHSCGRNPRCFERGEYRRQMARLRAQ